MDKKASAEMQRTYVSKINDDEHVLVKSFETDHSRVNVYMIRCTTQEQSEAIRERLWRGLAKISVDHWRRTGELL